MSFGTSALVLLLAAGASASSLGSEPFATTSTLGLATDRARPAVSTLLLDPIAALASTGNNADGKGVRMCSYVVDLHRVKQLPYDWYTIGCVQAFDIVHFKYYCAFLCLSLSVCQTPLGAVCREILYWKSSGSKPIGASSVCTLRQLDRLEAATI